MLKQSRKTKQKALIQEELNKTHTFFSADELFAKVKKRDPTIGIATVYRFLKDKKEKFELYAYLCDRKQVFSKQEKSHCHFICEATGKHFHFTIDSLDFLKKKIPGKITSVQLEVRGICENH